MNRLQSELHRLYLGGSPPAAEGDASPANLVDAQGRVRALVMELRQPASWEVLSRVWQGVQSDLELPAPAIAVSGSNGLQLWFSVAQPIAVGEARAFLESLRARFLPDVAAKRIRLWPDAASLHAPIVPALQEATGNWSAFVAPDLAAVFSDTPWLDIAPGEEGQAGLLRGLHTIKPTMFEDVARQLANDAAQATAAAAASPSTTPATAPAPNAAADPKRFLIGIMNDESVALALRIEAAKALLPYAVDAAPPRDA